MLLDPDEFVVIISNLITGLQILTLRTKIKSISLQETISREMVGHLAGLTYTCLYVDSCTKA